MKARWQAGAILLAVAAGTAPSLSRARPVVTLRSTPATVVREISRVRPPVLRVASGQIVRIDTIAQLKGMEDAVAFYGAAGIPARDVLADAVAIGKLPRPAGGGHLLTGPIRIDGAEPGDLLEVRILQVRPRVPYGVNVPGPDGVLPDLVPQRTLRTIGFDLKRGIARVAPGVEVPLAPFMGIMAVAPDPQQGVAVPTYAPGPFGGNMDLNRLTGGSTLFLPVFNDGALFYTGDPHAAQGDGEVNGTAIEASMSATLQFILHKGAGKPLHYPIAEDRDNFYILGMGGDLDTALGSATRETIAFLRRRAGLSVTDSYVLASVGVGFSIAEAVDGIKTVYGIVPKKAFKGNVHVH